jgi:hypothetical protein
MYYRNFYRDFCTELLRSGVLFLYRSCRSNRQLEVDPATLGRWERDEIQSEGKFKRRLDAFFQKL